MEIVEVAKNPAELERLCSRGVAPSPEIHAKVLSILGDVKKGGMQAALRYAKAFDGLEADSLLISESAVRESAAKAGAFLQASIREAISNVRRFHERQLETSWTMDFGSGVVLGQRIRPMKRVGLYVPGGAGVYPSTVIMCAVPALVAGVSEIVVVTPARGGIHPAVAFVLQELGIREVYHIGGAQAVGLLAYGAEGVERVDKIVGPGNVFAAVAKREVFGTVDIDMIAGPSEVLVLADETSNFEYVAADLLAQAEHGSGFEAAICITNSLLAAQKVAEQVEAQVKASPKREMLEKVLSNYGRILVVKDWEEGAAIANSIAPEHLEVLTSNAEELAEKIDNAGAVFIGPWSSEPVGDYFAGPNHVLPTNGTARFSSPLGVYDFLKRMSVIRYSEPALKKAAKAIAEIATAEGFYHHAQAVLKRL